MKKLTQSPHSVDQLYNETLVSDIQIKIQFINQFNILLGTNISLCSFRLIDLAWKAAVGELCLWYLLVHSQYIPFEQKLFLFVSTGTRPGYHFFVFNNSYVSERKIP